MNKYITTVFNRHFFVLALEELWKLRREVSPGMFCGLHMWRKVGGYQFLVPFTQPNIFIEYMAVRHNIMLSRNLHITSILNVVNMVQDKVS